MEATAPMPDHPPVEPPPAAAPEPPATPGAGSAQRPQPPQQHAFHIPPPRGAHLGHEMRTMIFTVFERYGWFILAGWILLYVLYKKYAPTLAKMRESRMPTFANPLSPVAYEAAQSVPFVDAVLEARLKAQEAIDESAREEFEKRKQRERERAARHLEELEKQVPNAPFRGGPGRRLMDPDPPASGAGTGTGAGAGAGAGAGRGTGFDHLGGGGTGGAHFRPARRGPGGGCCGPR
eukprot:tig00020944_g16386.t1